MIDSVDKMLCFNTRTPLFPAPFTHLKKDGKITLELIFEYSI
jgi:hypothetical protein